MQQAKSLRLSQSQQLLKRAEAVIPCQTQCFSKGPTQFVKGVSPHYAVRGTGCRVEDVDGNSYIDYMGALGPITLGYNHPKVNEAIRRQLEDGALLSLPHPLEVEVAEKLVACIPCAEMVRFTKTGSEATSAAVRIARAFTGRDLIVQSGYHGWHDWYAVTKPLRNRGIPKVLLDYILPFPYNNADSLQSILERNPGKVAAVMLEPSVLGPPNHGFLERCRKLTYEHGALLIFDEVIMGFRIALGGAQEKFNVVPDLATFGKGMANGMPLSAVMGRAAVMKSCDDIFYSSTFGGEILSLAACKAVIDIYQSEPVIEHLAEVGGKLLRGTRERIRRHGLERYIEIVGFDARSMFLFHAPRPEENLILKSLFHQEVVRRGILCNGYHNMTYAHSEEDIQRTLAVYDEAFEVLKEALDTGTLRERLQGVPMQEVFRPVQ
ncbi:MAG TPA: aminotransferase class III-fold pyridoxal phosphate-dependent enzyme [bacterium]|nr:aminotransferase class III-fold pyridoxal phosphate-dependent enzyme [bacterium]HQO33412.1 aminotransferase class III-fold pyridoxal phosphate-dependent enzyme [bacterium]HQP98199.1 aminotransferase class III-fold pyridoxal phosphate-dependent enzyme [bacterium]